MAGVFCCYFDDAGMVPISACQEHYSSFFLPPESATEARSSPMESVTGMQIISVRLLLLETFHSLVNKKFVHKKFHIGNIVFEPAY
jgi:hypothetical protein